MRRYQVFSRTSCTALFLLTSLLALSVTRRSEAMSVGA